jgi:hypothetical protein
VEVIDLMIGYRLTITIPRGEACLIMHVTSMENMIIRSTDNNKVDWVDLQ